MPDPVAVSPAERDPRWFLLLMACRWPLALVLAAWALALAVVQVLRQPIPIGLPLAQPLPVEGSVMVDQISQPLTVGSITDDVQVSTEEPLLVNGAVSVEQVGGQITVMLKNALQSISPIPLP